MANISEHHFCSSKCYGEWQRIHRKGVSKNRVLVTCYTCSKEFEKQPYSVVEHNFCSRECFAKWRSSPEWSGSNNPSWRGGHKTYRGENWNTQRKAARERDNDTCQACGLKGKNLPVHHKIPFHLFDDYRSCQFPRQSHYLVLFLSRSRRE